jgi:hypothetical protein
MQLYQTLESYKKLYTTLNFKVLRRSVFKEVERLLREKGYSPGQIKRILRWYE